MMAVGILVLPKNSPKFNTSGFVLFAMSIVTTTATVITPRRHDQPEAGARVDELAQFDAHGRRSAALHRIVRREVLGDRRQRHADIAELPNLYRPRNLGGA
jgi:hypothetical protein